MKDLLGMIPGIGNKIKDLDINDDSFKGIEAMINSMTPAERAILILLTVAAGNALLTVQERISVR